MNRVAIHQRAPLLIRIIASTIASTIGTTVLHVNPEKGTYAFLKKDRRPSAEYCIPKKYFDIALY